MIKKTLLFFTFILFLSSFAYARIGVVSSLHHEKTIRPGGSYQDLILIKNEGEDKTEVRVYKSDYLSLCDKVSYKDPGENPRSNSSWISYSPNYFNISPQQIVPVRYTVQVPQDENLKGSYWSMLMIEEIPEETPLKENGVKIRTIIRYAVTIITNVGEDEIYKLEFSDARLLREDERIIFQLDIKNIGDWRTSPFVWAELYNKEGAYIGRFEGQSSTKKILPTCCARFKIDLTQVPKGQYKALVVADCGGDDIFGATYTLRIEK